MKLRGSLHKNSRRKTILPLVYLVSILKWFIYSIRYIIMRLNINRSTHRRNILLRTVSLLSLTYNHRGVSTALCRKAYTGFFTFTLSLLTRRFCANLLFIIHEYSCRSPGSRGRCANTYLLYWFSNCRFNSYKNVSTSAIVKLALQH